MSQTVPEFGRYVGATFLYAKLEGGDEELEMNDSILRLKFAGLPDLIVTACEGMDHGASYRFDTDPMTTS